MAQYLHVNQRETTRAVFFPWLFDSVAARVYPVADAEKLSNQFPRYDVANQLRIYEDGPLSQLSKPAEITLKWGADITYQCQVRALRHPYKWLDAANADPALGYASTRPRQLVYSMRLLIEYDLIVKKLRSTTFSPAYVDLGGTDAQWDRFNSSTSRPIVTLQTAAINIAHRNGGRMPNRLEMNEFTLAAIQQHPEYQELSSKYVSSVTNSGVKAMIEALLNLKPGTVQSSQSVYNGAAEESAAPTYRAFIGPDVWMGWVEQLTLGQDEDGSQSALQRFNWSGIPNGETAIIEIPPSTETPGAIPGAEQRVVAVYDAIAPVDYLSMLIKNAIDGTNTAKYGTLLGA